MKKLLAILFFMPAALWAQSAFDGTWVMDPGATELPKKPHTYILEKGMYSCPTRVPKISVKADGSDQPVSGSKYFNTVAVRVVDAKTIEEVDKKDGKTMYKFADTVSDDGKKLTDKWEDDSGQKPRTGETVYALISKGPAGSHAISGSWRAEKAEDLSSNGTRITFQSTADGLKYSDNNGVTCDAKFNGKFYPEEGDPGNSMMSLKKVNDHSLGYTEKRDGKIVTTGHLTVSADGKKMTDVITNHERNTTTTVKRNKE